MQNKIPTQHSNQQGQSMVEYVLIVVLVVLAFVVAIAATGPAIGNVFSNTVYNLLGTDPDEIKDLPDKDAFWLTVTWVSQQTPIEQSIPTRTKIPNTEVPTEGPSPTHTATVPTNTPVPTMTPTPSPTPEDFKFVAPWHDSGDDDEYWRLGGDVFLGTDLGWYANYYSDQALTEFSAGEYTSKIDPDKKYNLDFNWGNGAPIADWPVGHPDNDFGVSYRRQIHLETELTLLFTLEFIDDSARIWLLPGHGDIKTVNPGSCSATGATWGGNPSGGGNARVYDDASAFPTDCLLLDGWWGIYGQTATVKRTVPSGSYTVVVDMAEGSGGAGIKVGIDAAEFKGNLDDTTVDGSGNPTSGSADCRWGNVEDTRDSNSSDFRWDSWESGYDFATGNRCYLELRGSVKIPTGMTEPILTFWDVWDFGGSNMKAWIEIAEYDPDGDGTFDRNDLTWVRRDLHTGNTTNYNWTYQRIDLADMMSGVGPVEDTEYAIRFGMEVPSGLYYPTGNDRGYRLWWVDSINIDVAPQKVFYPAMFWDLNAPEQADDFITSGRWSLSSAKVRGTDGMAWDDSAGSDYVSTNLDGCGQSYTGGWATYSYRTCSDFDNKNVRMHSLEFNGIVDLDNPLGAADLENNVGDAMLTFWHAYDLDDETGLEIQYSTDLTYDSGEAPVWKLVPGGQINVRNLAADVTQTTMVFAEINLEGLKALEPAANGKFRIRFVLTQARISNSDPGWWIDDIQLEREAISSFLPYPYVETFQQEASLNDWLLSGSWGRADNHPWQPVSSTEYSLTDSPYVNDSGGNPQQVNYADSQDSSAEIRLAFDVHNNSPLNPFSPACALIPSDLCDEPNNVTPIDPVLTFQWWHDFDRYETFSVEWKKAVDTDNVWKELWSYQDCMWYNDSSNCETRSGLNWQRVEIDLRQLLASANFNNNLPDSLTDDDILIRFRLQTGSSYNNADGVYIDEIRIEERVEKSFALWDEGVSANVENPNFPSSDPLIYTTGGFRYIRVVAESSIQGNQYAGGAEFNLLDKNGNTIDRSGWSVTYVDSEQASNYLIGKMLDGNINTFWHTQYSGGSPSHPHEFRINLGANYQVGFFKYLARQDHVNSRLKDYKFYLSTNGSTWQLAGEGTLSDTTTEQTAALRVDYTTNTAPSGGSGTTTVVGDGVSYRDNLDDRANEIFENWYIGGTWDIIEWENYDGILAFHSSTNTPWNSGNPAEIPPPNSPTFTPDSGRTYNILEMSTIIDLRATHENKKPIMTFWQRHHIGSGTDIRVQISVENPATIGTASYCGSSGRDQCYDHYYGWSTWETAPPWNISGYDDWDLSGQKYQYLWKREIVDLSSFAASDSDPGQRIRIRFVSDSLSSSVGNGNLRDGWYLDNIEFKYNAPSVVNIDADTGDSFFDGARNTRNWLSEGTWGLSPEFFRGSGGGPADFGGAFWTYWYFDLTSQCTTNSTGSFATCASNYFNSMPNPDSNINNRLVKKGLALDINNEWGSGGPFGLSYKFGGIWELTTPVIGTTMNPGTYTFVFTYDDALRVKYDTVPAGGLPVTDTNGDPIIPSPYAQTWNIFNDFNAGSRQVGIGNATFENGKRYKIRMEYFDMWNDAAFIMSLGSSSFSFTDSPKIAAGAAFPEVPAAPRSTSSLMFNGVFDLKDAVAPILQYYTFHELGGTARVEVSRDGGFLWTQQGLAGSAPSNFWSGPWRGDFWNDESRSSNQKMAYRLDGSGNHLWDTATYPPGRSVASYTTGDLNYNWGNQAPVTGWTRPNGQPVIDNWSAQFRRSFTLASPMQITFKVTTDDGHRLWLNENGTGYYPACQYYNSSNPYVSGKPLIGGENGTTYSDGAAVIGNGCMLATRWSDSGSNYSEVTRTIPAGTHELIVDFYEGGGGNSLKLELIAGSYDQPSYSGTYMPNNGSGDWLEKNHWLGDYAGYESNGDPKPPISLRFRLDRLGESETGNYQQQTNQPNPYPNWMESWWLTDITVVDTVAGP